MRTRLDEIVEEESMTEHSYRRMAMRIAQRAWLLGISDCGRGAHGDWVIEKGPAPARLAATEMWFRCRCKRHEECTGHCAQYGCPKFGDRRKGERRKWAGSAASRGSGPGPYTWSVSPNGTRREGSDRRRRTP
jgi:hypothetical protein